MLDSIDLKISNIQKEISDSEHIDYEKIQKEIEDMYNKLTECCISCNNIQTLCKVQKYKIQLLEMSDLLMFTHNEDMRNALDKLHSRFIAQTNIQEK